MCVRRGRPAPHHRCTQTQFLWDGFNMWQVQQKTRWHDHIIADPQTNHLFKRHFKRLPRKATRWGLEKSCAFFYFPSVIIQLDLRSLLWCMKCCARIYKIQRRDRCLSLRHVKSENCLKVSVYTIASRGDFILRIKVKAFNITFVVHSESSVFSMDEKKKTSRHPKQSFLCCLL